MRLTSLLDKVVELYHEANVQKSRQTTHVLVGPRRSTRSTLSERQPTRPQNRLRRLWLYFYFPLTGSVDGGHAAKDCESHMPPNGLRQAVTIGDFPSRTGKEAKNFLQIHAQFSLRKRLPP